MTDTSHEHETQAQLSARLVKANTQVTVGGRYMHYKKLTYKVLGLALREEDNEPCVVYQAEYGNHITFIRPVADWIKEVKVDGKKVPRFAEILDFFTIVSLQLPDNRIVLQRRTKDAPHAPGKLGFFGGRLEPMETLDECLARHLKTKTSLSPDNLHFQTMAEFDLPRSEAYDKPRHFYLYRIVIPKSDFEVHEGDGAEAFTLQELKQRDDLGSSVEFVLEKDLF